MKIVSLWKRFWRFLKEDTWQSWLVSLILAFLVIKFVFFPVMSLIFVTPLPLVVVESCSMYHNVDFDNWWDNNSPWYIREHIEREDFEDFSFRNGLNKGDIILVSGRGDIEVGDVIIFNSDFRFPLIHRVVEKGDKTGTKGDNNFNQLNQEKNIEESSILGKAIIKIPGLGWLKLIFFESSRTDGQRGFCK